MAVMDESCECSRLTNDCDGSHIAAITRFCMFARRFIARHESAMLFKLFRKSLATRPRIEPDTALAEELERRMNAIEFRPSKGFLKDRQLPKRVAVRVQRPA
jgi:hypothetical protein